MIYCSHLFPDVNALWPTVRRGKKRIYIYVHLRSLLSDVEYLIMLALSVCWSHWLVALKGISPLWGLLNQIWQAIMHVGILVYCLETAQLDVYEWKIPIQITTKGKTNEKQCIKYIRGWNSMWYIWQCTIWEHDVLFACINNSLRT